MKAKVTNITLDYKDGNRNIVATIDAKGSMYVEEPKGMGFPAFYNSAPLVEGFNLVLEMGHHAVGAIKGNKEFMELREENQKLRANIQSSELAYRVRQLLSCLDYDKLTDFQAKVVLLVERELGSTTQQIKS